MPSIYFDLKVDVTMVTFGRVFEHLDLFKFYVIDLHSSVDGMFISWIFRGN